MLWGRRRSARRSEGTPAAVGKGAGGDGEGRRGVESWRRGRAQAAAGRGAALGRAQAAAGMDRDGGDASPRFCLGKKRNGRRWTSIRFVR